MELYKHSQQTMKNTSKFALLSVMVTVAMNASALEQLDDNKLAGVSGQDGIAISAEMSDASIDSVSWQDGTQGSLVFGQASSPISITPTTGNSSVGTTATIQTAANADGIPGLNVNIGLGSAQVDIPYLGICSADGTSCEKLGALAVTNAGTETTFSLVTSKGLLSEDGNAKLKAIIDQMSVAVKQDNGGTTNQLVLGNMYANMTADGKLFVSNTEGLKFIGTVDFDQRSFSGTQREGLEVLVQHQTGTDAIQTLGKIALTGSMTDVDLSLRGVKGTVQGLGFDNGENGIAMRLSANFNKDLKVKLGDSSGLGLTNWKTIGDAKSFDSGNVYLNIVKNDDTVIQSLPTNNRLTISDQIIQQEEATADYLSRSFEKEVGDTQVFDFETSAGKRYVTDANGNVLGADGSTVKAFTGLTNDPNQGIVNKDGVYLPVDTYVKDGFKANGTVVSFPDGGDGSFLNYYQDDGSVGGNFEQVVKINSDGSSELYRVNLYDEATGTGNNRGLRQIYIWRSLTNGSSPQGVNTIVVGSYDNIVGNEPTQANAWFKAVNLVTGNYKSGDNLTNITTPHYKLSANNEVVDNNNVVFMERHTFNQLGFLQKKSDGSYVYQYTYTIDENTNELVLTDKVTQAEVQRIPLKVLSSDVFGGTNQSDYEMTNATISGDDGTTTAGQSISLNVRDMSLQGYATQTEFFEKDTARTDKQNWSVAPVIYKLDANALLFSKTLNDNNTKAGYTQAGEAIGYKATLTTKGSDSTDTSYAQTGAKQTTGLLLTHSDKADASKTRYVGLRHVDSLIKTQGDIQIAGDVIAITANDLLFAFRGELATGLMPNAGETFGLTDRLAIVEGKLTGDIAAKVIARDKGIGVNASIDLADSAQSGVRVISPEGGSSIVMNGITGTAVLDATIATVNMAADQSANYNGALNVKGTLTVNPENTQADDIRIRNIGFSATPLASTVDKFSPYSDNRIGEMALTNHNIYTDLKIRSAP